MYRITAINNEPDTEEEDYSKVTQEAEETILMSEYVRALKLQKDNFVDDALSLFNEMLQTELLFEVTKTHTSKTLRTIKYNCYKNIAFIHSNQKKNEQALEYLLKAIELDDTDIYTVNKLGQIALNLKHLDVAEMAFEICLKNNPTHWPAGDGILQILCLREQYNEAYGWALKWYDQNPKYKRALNVISEIQDKFSVCGLDYIENSWSIRFKDKSIQQKCGISVFPEPEFEEKVEPIRPNIDEFKMESFEKLNWLKFGLMIKKLYKHLGNIENGSALSTIFESGDFLLEEVQSDSIENTVKEEPPSDRPDMDTELKEQQNETDNDIQMDEKQEYSNSDSALKCTVLNTESANSVDGSTEDSDAPTTGDDTKPAAKPKSRRRGSDLKLLDPWFYWKNRKCSQRQRNKQLERMETDTTVNGLLRKILEKYYEDNFDDESPFHPNASSTTDRSTTTGSNSVTQPLSIEDFQAGTKESFVQMINEIKEKSFNVITLVGKWIQYISTFWELKVPNEILNLYMKLFRKYLKHHDLSSWNLLNEYGFEEVFRMTIFYLELSHERALRTAEPNIKNEADEHWLMLFNHIVINSGLHEFNVIETTAFKYQMRLNWLQYCLSRYEYDLRRSVNCLNEIRKLILSNNNASFVLNLPNQVNNNKIDVQTANETITMLERMINLNNVHQLYTDQQYTEMVEILKDSLANTTKSKNIDNLVLKLNEQFEVILECFWNLQSIEECLIWCERCLKYALDRFLDASPQSISYIEWAKCINFILSYIEAIILDESYMIVKCLERYYARLIQSIVRIIANQLDTDDKSNNQVHPINLKTPWIILHHILQREEDMKSNKKRKLSSDSSSSNENATSEGDATDTEEDLIPKSISIFFTAHEYLGNRTWCTKDNGELLLYIIDTVIPRLRTPYLEHCRNEVIEYLEQITCCLFRFPAKRARLKHLEKHESQNIELNWSHAIQLYDLYRPTKMPEFDMFKRDSITSEMEQLLQRIIAIIPAEIDPSTQCDAMEKFIAGEIGELPKALDILPYHINSIYYLLADYYFKNKDFSKALKYYIADLSNLPNRFDAWAGLSLSKAHLMGTNLNSCSIISTKEWIQHSEEVLRCFEQCLKIDEQQHMLWIEYGNYAYALHSYCSRCLKQSNDCVLTENFDFLKETKEQCLKITHDCFIKIDNMKPIAANDDASEGSDDEKWLYHYMLGKVAEKRKQSPNIVIEHYLKSAEALYENNATYPFKISSVNPQNLALEALEIFYRITATIIKYMEQHSGVTYGIGKFFNKVLNQQAKSPFALSQAKINENILNAHLQRKRKLTMTNEEANKQKVAKIDASPATTPKIISSVSGPKETEPIVLISVKTEPAEQPGEQPAEQPAETETIQLDNEDQDVGQNKDTEAKDADKSSTEDAPDKNNQSIEIDQAEQPQIKSETNIIDENVDSPLRRGSQESTATTTTQTTTSTSTDSTSSSSESSSSSDSSSDTDDSTSEDDANKDENAPLDEKRIDSIYEMCIKNLEECITRYPEHYKSIYRLALIYMNGPEKIRDIQKCNQLLLGTYTTVLGNQVQGLFTDRKNNNLFNGFWRNKSSEIERPGSFSSHLSKCVNILMQILKVNKDYKLLMEIIFHNSLQRVPDADKRYIKDSERKELLEMATLYCVQSFKHLLRKHSLEQRNDNELLSLIIDIFKAHKKMKNVSQKESPFSGVLVDTYKAYAEGKVWLQENVNYLDSANKFCISLTNNLKNQEKQQQLTGQRQTLEELGLRNLPSSLSKACTAMPNVISPMATVQPTATVIGGLSPVVTQMRTLPPVIPAVTAVIVTTMATITATTTASPCMITSMPTAMNTTTVPSAAVQSVNSTTIQPVITSRPRGRPPGSKNQTSKATDKNAALQQQKMMTSLLQPFAGALPNLEMIAKLLDPSVSSVVMALLAEPNFMKTLAMFPDQNSRTTLLKEYFTISKYPNIQQLIDGFNAVYNCLVVALQQQTSVTSLMQPNLKQVPKIDKPFMATATVTATATAATAVYTTATATITATSMPSQASSMSIFPTANKPHPSLTNTSPSKPVISPSIPASITPIPSSNSLLKPGVSTVISIGAGQLTITPSVSITPNITKSTPALQIPTPSFSMQQAPQPKISARRSAGDRPANKKPPKVQRLSQGPFTDLPQIKVENLPKSLSIIPSPSTHMPSIKPSTSSTINVDLLPNKPAKQTKAKKKSLDANTQFAKSSPVPAKIPKLDASVFSKSMVNSQMQAQLNASLSVNSSALNQISFLSHYEQFLSGAPQTTLSLPKPTKTKTSTVPSAASKQPQPGTIKVKQLEQLQGRQTLTIDEKQSPKTKQMYPTPNVGNIKNTPISGNSTVLNAYGTTISSISSSSQSVPNSFSSVSAIASIHPTGVQISPTKTLQQKLAERQRQFSDVNTQSRPSSTSSAGSSKTRKSDTEVIVLD